MDGGLERGQVMPAAHPFGQFQHPAEHRRDELAVRHPVALDQAQVLLGIEFLHDDHGPAVADGQVDRRLRRRVIQRGGREVGKPVPVLPQPGQEAEHGELVTGRDVVQGPHDALGPAGRARGVQHRRPQAFIGYRRAGEGAGRFLEVSEDAVVSGAVHDQAGRQPRAVPRRLQGHLAARPGGDQEPGGAVVQDVGQLRRGQVGVDARVVQARPLPRTAGLQVPVVVLHEDGIVIQPAQPPGAQQMSQPVSPGLVLGVRNALAGRGHHERGLTGPLTSMRTWVHRIPLRAGSSPPTVSPHAPAVENEKAHPALVAASFPDATGRTAAAAEYSCSPLA